MKKLSLIFFVLSVFLGITQAENDSIYILKNGSIKIKYSLAEIDSIIFYRPAIVDSLNIESTKFLDMATRAANYIDTNQKIPNEVSYSYASQTRSVSAAEFYYMMARWLRYLKVNGEQATPPPVRIVRGTAVPPTPTGSMSGTFTKDDILTKGQSNADFIEANGYVPNYSTVGSTQYSPVAIYYAMAKTIRYYAQNNNTLPTSVNVSQVTCPFSWPATSDKVYLGITTTKLRDAINIAWKSTSYGLSIRKQPNVQNYYIGISVNSNDAASVRSTIANQTGVTFSQGSSDPASGWYSIIYPTTYWGDYLNYADGWRVTYTQTNIVATTMTVIANANTVSAMANAIFNFVNGLKYSYYNNSQKGAYKTLYDGSGNCCDQSNLLVSMFRAAGITCGFVHGYYKAASSPNHCWTRAWIDGNWVLYDPTSSSHYGDAWFSYYNSW